MGLHAADGLLCPPSACERTFRELVHHAPIGIAWIDAADRVISGNPAFTALVTPEPGDAGPVIGQPLSGWLAAEDRPDVLARLAAVRQGEEISAPLEVHMCPGQRERVVHLYARQLQGSGSVKGPPGVSVLDGSQPGGEAALLPPGTLALHFIDMTEPKNLESQFAHAQKMQAVGQLAGGIAHDFNNLLTAVTGYCDLLLQRHNPGDPSFADIMQIKQNTARAANLVRQLLAFSRQQTLKPRVLNITDVLRDLTTLLRRLIGEHIVLKMEHGCANGLVKVDQGQFEQVIVNLAINARDAMPRGGQLTLSTHLHKADTPSRQGPETVPPGEYVVIEVADSGNGIAPEHLSRIFEPFFTTKPVGTGTGLGLSTVYGIVRQTGGFVFVKSAPGCGARFTIFLPRHQGQSAADPPPAEAEIREALAPEKLDLCGVGTILLVEDEEAVRVFSARALRNKGYQVLEAGNGDDALVLLQEAGGKVDLLISDVVMPGLDGPALYQEVRRSWPALKVIFISGYAEERFQDLMDSDAPITFLPKPFSLKQLAGRVKDVMERTP